MRHRQGVYPRPGKLPTGHNPDGAVMECDTSLLDASSSLFAAALWEVHRDDLLAAGDELDGLARHLALECARRSLALLLQRRSVFFEGTTDDRVAQRVDGVFTSVLGPFEVSLPRMRTRGTREKHSPMAKVFGVRASGKLPRGRAIAGRLRKRAILWPRRVAVCRALRLRQRSYESAPRGAATWRASRAAPCRQVCYARRGQRRRTFGLRAARRLDGSHRRVQERWLRRPKGSAARGPWASARVA